MRSRTFYVFTDGSALGNPGPGGWTAVLIRGSKSWEISGASAWTTISEMELLAAVEEDCGGRGISTLPGSRKSVYYPHKEIVLNAIPPHSRRIFGSKPSTFGIAAVVCLVLLALLAVAQVTHVHAVGSDADHCPLCVVMHSVVPFVVLAVGIVMIRLGTEAHPPLEVRTICRYWHPTLFNRPPPAGC
jgi:hypothetical protein